MTSALPRRGDYVRVGKGRKVYQVVAEADYATDGNGNRTEGPHYKLAATADHPDAAVREMDAWAWYPPQRLTVVGRHQRRRRT